MAKQKFPQMIFALLFILLSYLIWLIFQPMLGALIFGGILAGSFYPLFNILQRYSKMKKEICAVTMCGLIALLIFLPITLLTIKLSQETIHLYKNLTEGLTSETLRNFLFGHGRVAQFLEHIFKFFELEFNLEVLKAQLFPHLQNFSTYLIKTINGQVEQIFTFLWDFVLMQFFMYTIFAKGDHLKNFIFELSPLPPDQEQLLLTKFNQMNYVSLVCNGVGGLIQGGLAGLAFWAVGIESALLWSAIMVVLAFIPLLGISLVTIPACIYLWIQESIPSAIGLFIFCTLVALITENVFKPRFIGERVKMPSLVVFFSIVGGMSYFGVAGIFYGPLIAIVFMTLVELYHQYYWKNQD